MNCTLDPTVAEGYTSKAQRSRVITETWAEENLYCPNCGSDSLEAHRPGKRVEDFRCPSCDRRIQLKSKRGGHGNKVASSAYKPTIEAIRAGEAPDYAFMGFDPNAWQVTDLFLVPSHFMTPSVIEKRKPLGSDARRSGWVGSNILLDRIPETGRVEIIESGEVIPREAVQSQFDRTLFLSEKGTEARNWTTAVMNCIDDLPVRPGDCFELADVYGFEDRLAETYPDNQNVRAKIRQQMQELRNIGLVEFLGNGEYRLRWVDDRELR